MLKDELVKYFKESKADAYISKHHKLDFDLAVFKQPMDI